MHDSVGQGLGHIKDKEYQVHYRIFGRRWLSLQRCARGGPVSRAPEGRRTQHAVMATASEWARIRELAADAGMEVSRYVVRRATQPDPLPGPVLRRAVRELLLLSRLEEARMADMGLGERWRAMGDAVDAWLDRETELDRLSDAGAAERWRAVSASGDPEGGPAPRP